MKTITLSDQAYERLKAWKEESHESFSQIVLKKVPKRGTLGHLLENIQRLPPLSEAGAKAMRETLAEANDWKGQEEPWTA